MAAYLRYNCRLSNWNYNSFSSAPKAWITRVLAESGRSRSSDFRVHQVSAGTTLSYYGSHASATNRSCRQLQPRQSSKLSHPVIRFSLPTRKLFFCSRYRCLFLRVRMRRDARLTCCPSQPAIAAARIPLYVLVQTSMIGRLIFCPVLRTLLELGIF